MYIKYEKVTKVKFEIETNAVENKNRLSISDKIGLVGIFVGVVSTVVTLISILTTIS